jgi:hypothetical protein
MRLSRIPRRLAPPTLALAALTALAGCLTSSGDKNAYSGTLTAKLYEYQIDTLHNDACVRHADSLFWERGFESQPLCGYNACDSEQETDLMVASLPASCKEAGGRRDTLFIVAIRNTRYGSFFLSQVDPGSYSFLTDTAGTSFYVRKPVREVPYHSTATITTVKSRVGDYYVIKSPDVTESTEVTGECYSEVDLTPGYKTWWPAEVGVLPEYGQIRIYERGGVCALGDKYRLTVTND